MDWAHRERHTREDADAGKRILGLPVTVQPVAYLCVGGVAFFRERPELEGARS